MSPEKMLPESNLDGNICKSQLSIGNIFGTSLLVCCVFGYNQGHFDCNGNADTVNIISTFQWDHWNVAVSSDEPQKLKVWALVVPTSATSRSNSVTHELTWGITLVARRLLNPPVSRLTGYVENRGGKNLSVLGLCWVNLLHDDTPKIADKDDGMRSHGPLPNYDGLLPR